MRGFRRPTKRVAGPCNGVLTPVFLYHKSKILSNPSKMDRLMKRPTMNLSQQLRLVNGILQQTTSGYKRLSKAPYLGG